MNSSHKHYYAGSERIASKTGGGGIIDLVKIVTELLTNAGIWKRTFEPLWTKKLRMLPPEARKEATCTGLYDLRKVKEKEKDIYYYHPDHLGSSAWITGSSGQPVQHLQYLPFGETRVDQRTTGWNTRYTFSSKEKDEESGYSYFGARYYDADLSIWLSVDPMAHKYPHLSPYNYCANNPIKLIDPDGRLLYITGPQAADAYTSLQQTTNLELSLGKDGIVTITGGEIKNEYDQQLANTINDVKVTVNIYADEKNTQNPHGGAYMGTEYNWETKTAISTNEVNMTKLTKTEKDNKTPTGSGVLHEATEGYQAGLIALSMEQSIQPAVMQKTFTEFGINKLWVDAEPLYPTDHKLYLQAHNKATPAPNEMTKRMAQNFKSPSATWVRQQTEKLLYEIRIMFYYK